MPIYDLSVRELFKEFIVDTGLTKGQIFTKRDAIFWFKNKYPKIKEGTIIAHLILLSTNLKGRINRKPRPNGQDDLFFQTEPSHYRLYEPEVDPRPLPKDVSPEALDLQELSEDLVEAKEFPYESDLKNFLSKNLNVIEPGLKLYDDGEGTPGIEFPAGGRFIDILALDKEGNFVVIELKASRGYDRVIGQLLRYMAWIEKNQAEPGQKVRGIIVARNISEDLSMAASKIKDVQLFEYELSVTLKKLMD